MNVFDAIHARQSVRAYIAREIEPEKLQKIFDSINQAPSAGNLQAYRVWIVRDNATKKKLAAAALGQDFMAQAPVVLVFCAEPGRSRRYGARGAELYCIQDATIAAAYAQLAAAALGLATCWIGAFDEKQVSFVLGLPAGSKPITMLTVGYPAETPPRTGRRPLSEMFVDHR
ncbi:MAG: nitroreductase family protein [Verrucomicrobiae bacterium]|nr:nitroreductase family protein [Verrucomicrobiae bacterium]